ncbi:hypothetical protein F8M41_022562 [Gigaspora margarita]|uniref:Uncharacterized protein n=1 Tax=Gigaspora margarita TaxID=4874 RepID=A0A8H4B156_GIGMA|nr:hypothetical protein F8M41_022562 [Gigaspora margarita]
MFSDYLYIDRSYKPTCTFCGVEYANTSFTLKLSYTLKMTKPLCKKAECLGKLVELQEELVTTDDLKEKTSIVLKHVLH